MDYGEVQLKFLEAVRKVLERDAYLLSNDINEPCISHRLGMYLAERFETHDVDCEYNGDIDSEKGRKVLYVLEKTVKDMGVAKDKDAEGEYISCSIYPDIIVHKRGFNGPGNNLLVVEVKKSSNPHDGKWDREKLARFTSSEYDNHYEYDFGVFIRFLVGENIGYEVEWYKKGQLFEE